MIARDVPMSIEKFTNMLTMKRPHGSARVGMFIAQYLSDIMGASCRAVDDFGNIIVVVSPTYVGESPLTELEGLPKVMFTSHIDTVHRNDGYQTVLEHKGFLTLGSGGNCLGADDASGVYIMLEMIKAEKEGVYIFHQGEECGGLGSTFIQENHPEFLQQFDMAIALDRKGEADVITHQWGGRCCSDKFAWALANALNAQGSIFTPADTGIFTDTATYVMDIPECTNISVGYNFEHTTSEEVNFNFMERLIESMVQVDFNTLPIERAPTDWEFDDYGYEPANGDEGYYTDLDVDYYSRHMTKDLAEELVYQEPDYAVRLLVAMCK